MNKICICTNLGNGSKYTLYPYTNKAEKRVSLAQFVSVFQKFGTKTTNDSREFNKGTQPETFCSKLKKTWLTMPPL